jgi:peptidyl-prolyl cis-trans isomerase A (cyclophilin A)
MVHKYAMPVNSQFCKASGSRRQSKRIGYSLRHQHYCVAKMTMKFPMTKTLTCLLLSLFSAVVLAQEAPEAFNALTEAALPPAEAQPIETPQEEAPKPMTVKVRMHTALGDIVLQLETERAPITAANFLRYVDGRRFDGMGFYRGMKVDETGNYGLVQTGVREANKLLKPIAHEPTTVTGLSHVNGAISMARLAPGSATADFFIIIGDLPSLDAQPNTPGDNLGYAVFGRVIEGMDVVKAINEQPRSLTAGEGVMKGQMLETPVKVLTVRRE